MKTLSVAVLDLNNGTPNQGIFCIERILDEFRDTAAELYGVAVQSKVFGVRDRFEVPNAEDYDIYISSGGPGSPFEGVGLAWEISYFSLIDRIVAHNENRHDTPKCFYGICHTFELLSRYFEIGDVVPIPHKVLGIYPINLTDLGREDPMLRGLYPTLYAFEARSWEVRNLAPRYQERVLATNTVASVDGDPNISAIRITDDIEIAQFHPEGDPEGIMKRLSQTKAKLALTATLGQVGYDHMLHNIDQPDYIARTRNSVLPGFLKRSTEKILGETRQDLELATAS